MVFKIEVYIMNRGSFSVGDMVTAGLRIYRDRFRTYYPLAFIANLWLLVPIYGWAKYAAATGLISRLAFFEVIEKPETVTQARNHINPRMWSFFLAGLLVFLIVSVASLVLVAVFLILGFAAGGIFNGDALTILIGSVVFLLWMILYVWLFSRFSLAEVCLGIESLGASAGVSRSWVLTQRFVGKLLLIFFVAFIILIPAYIISNLSAGIVQTILGAIFPPESTAFTFIFLIFSLLINVAFNALVMPFWQSIKAVIYYDLRSRREGIDLGI
ncbi:hypothetical protein [Gloeocapsa sp. PCC 73106]|uniref:hypothetical protein n=1 Tax=Gloeocapsa sp. PCC 73106 TaxID=102232 RepID=UPI0002ACE40D|nr:hypothetical protein [Gloeocapsa sp. PCC 73106]ELR98377.1 hypothetical protein GLO73106DRAFT_00022080 [Gloeocapsa sp. PCC 73106]